MGAGPRLLGFGPAVAAVPSFLSVPQELLCTGPKQDAGLDCLGIFVLFRAFAAGLRALLPRRLPPVGFSRDSATRLQCRAVASLVPFGV